MPFGRSAKPNNRSQHSLAVESAGSVAGIPSASGPGPGAVSIPVTAAVQSVGLAGASAAPGAQPQVGPGPGHPQLQQGPSSASALGQGPSNLSLSANESFVQDPRAINQKQQLPPPHLYATASGDSQASQAALHHAAQLHQQLHPINTNPAVAVTDARARKAAHDFVDAVARSQSQRYHQVVTPVQPNSSYGASYEDLPNRTSQPVNPQHPAFAYQQQPPPSLPQQQGTPVEPRRSTRRLIKNILAGAPKNEQQRTSHSHHHHTQSQSLLLAQSQSQSHSQSQSQSQSHNFYDTAHPGRRSSSKRISNPNPPALRTGPSQVSLDQQSLDWQSQGTGTQTQPSPLQNVRLIQLPRRLQFPRVCVNYALTDRWLRSRTPTNSNNRPSVECLPIRTILRTLTSTKTVSIRRAKYTFRPSWRPSTNINWAKLFWTLQLYSTNSSPILPSSRPKVRYSLTPTLLPTPVLATSCLNSIRIQKPYRRCHTSHRSPKAISTAPQTIHRRPRLLLVGTRPRAKTSLHVHHPSSLLSNKETRRQTRHNRNSSSRNRIRARPLEGHLRPEEHRTPRRISGGKCHQDLHLATGTANSRPTA